MKWKATTERLAEMKEVWGDALTNLDWFLEIAFCVRVKIQQGKASMSHKSPYPQKAYFSC